MTVDDLTVRLVRMLDEVGVPYMIVGSVASSYHGEPRTTRDVDVVIDPDADGLRTLERLATAGFYVDRDF